MALSYAVQNSRHIAQQITWTDEDGTVVNLTGATITGFIKNSAGTTRAIDGTLTLVTAASGIFSWAYGAVDVGTAGDFLVQFVATYASTLKEITLQHTWRVFAALSVSA